MDHFPTYKIKAFGFIAIAFTLFIIGVGIYNFITHPFKNKSIVKYVRIHLKENEQDYAHLIDYMDTVQAKYKVFNFQNHPKKGIVFSVVDSERIKEGYPDKFRIQSDFSIPDELKQIFNKMEIDNFQADFKNNISYYVIYKNILNHSMTEKKVTLYYFKSGYRLGFFDDNKLENQYSRNYSNEYSKDWIFQVDSNWVIRSKEKK